MKPHTPKQFKAARIKAGMTQTALANALGVSRRTIVRMESGEYQLTFKDRIALEYVVSLPSHREGR